MAQYNENAKLLAQINRDKNRLKAQIAGSVDQIQIGKRQTNVVQVYVHNIVISTRAPSDGFILDHPTYGVLNTSAMNGGGFSSWAEVTRERWEYLTQTQLETGTYSGVDLSNDDIRLS